MRGEGKCILGPWTVSALAGIRLRAKAPGPIRGAFGSPEAKPPEAGGTCTVRCHDVQGRFVYLGDKGDAYLVRWDRLEQGGWGAESGFRTATSRCRGCHTNFDADGLALCTYDAIGR